MLALIMHYLNLEIRATYVNAPINGRDRNMVATTEKWSV